MSGVEIIKVKQTDDGMRLNRWFLKYYPSLTLGRFQKLLRTKQIKVDGKKAEANLRVFMGQEIRVPPLDNEKAIPTEHFVSAKDAGFIQSLVIYKDDNIIVINKPAGLAVQGGTGVTRHIDGMLNALKFEKEESPRLVHRIDKETSGILVLARNRKFADILTKNFREHLMEKTYIALAHNCPPDDEGKLSSPIEDKKAQTIFRVISTVGQKFSLLMLSPLTGRKHQIRLHLRSIGCPIVGDDKYFIEPKIKIADIKNKLYLHAYKIDLSCLHNKNLEVIAPIPAHFSEAFDVLGIEFKG